MSGCEFARARAELDALSNSADLYEVAKHHVTRWPKHPPDFFYDSGTKRLTGALEALGNGEDWACRLVSVVPNLHFYSLRHTHLGLPAAAAAPERFLHHSTAACWKRAIKGQLSGSLYWRLELGDAGVHAHVLAADNAGLLHLPRGGEIVKPVYDLLGAVAYLCKPAMFYTAENLALWLEAKRCAQLPNLSGTMRLPNKRTWLNPSASVHTFTSGPAAAFESPPDNRPDDRTPLPASDRPAASATWEIPKLDPYSAAAAARAAEWEINTSYDLVPITKRDPPTTKLVIRRKGWVRRVLACRRRAASYGLST